MRKTLSLTVVAVSALALAACLPGKPAVLENVKNQAMEKVSETAGGGMAEIAQKVMAGQGFRCTFTQKQTGQSMSYAIKGKKVAMQIVDPTDSAKKSNMIVDTDFSYMWDPATKKGMKFAIPKDLPTPTPGAVMKPTTPGVPQTPDLSDANAWLEAQKEYDINCTPANLSDSEFVPPTDVEFQDLSVMMKQMPGQPGAGAGMGVPKTMEYQGNIPAGMMPADEN